MEITQGSLQPSDKDESDHPDNSFGPCRCMQKHNAKMRDQPEQDESHGTPTLEKTSVLCSRLPVQWTCQGMEWLATLLKINLEHNGTFHCWVTLAKLPGSLECRRDSWIATNQLTCNPKSKVRGEGHTVLLNMA